MLKIVTDTGACLPEDILQPYKISLVPGYIVFGDETFLDHYQMTNDEFYRRLAGTKVLPSSVDPTPEQFSSLYETLATAFPGAIILSIHTSSSVATTVESAQKAAASFPRATIHVFDTRSVGLGQGLMVYEAARLAAAELSASEILKRLAAMRDGMKLYFTLDTLDYLAHTGRVGPAIRVVGNLLDIKPVLTMHDGVVESFDQPRSRARALVALRDLVLNACMGKRELRVGVMHAGCEKEARQIADELKAELLPEVLLFNTLGAGVGANVGPGALGVCWWWPGNIPIRL